MTSIFCWISAVPIFLCCAAGIFIWTHTTLIETISDAARTVALHTDDTVIKLFYREHHRYRCHSLNWGVSKGLDNFHDVCIVMGASH